MALFFVIATLIIGCSDEDFHQDTETSVHESFEDLGQKSSKSVQLDDRTTTVKASTEQSSNPASEAMDGNTDPTSRWSGLGKSATLDIDLKTVDLVDYLRILFFKGDERKARFEVYAKPNNSGSWVKINTKTSSGDDSGFEIFDLKNTETRYLRILGLGNSKNDWNSIVEIQVWGTPGEGGSQDEEDEDDKEQDDDKDVIGEYNLSTNKAPSENFDLSTWKLTLSSGDEVKVKELNDEFVKSNQFYTDPSTGGMVFKNYPDGAGTTSSSSYSRVELREMLRSFNDDDIDAKGLNGNNWVNSSSSDNNRSKAGGVDGVLQATLEVNRVTNTSEEDWQVGRIIIGQIHAEEDEPCRLYYHKQPHHNKGAIYMAHEPVNGNTERFYNLIGEYMDESATEDPHKYRGAGEPSNGIPLNEQFSYKIEVNGDILDVVIYDKNKNEIASKRVDMGNSGYEDEWMYYKAGLYSGNKSVKSSSDHEKVTFYVLSATHD